MTDRIPPDLDHPPLVDTKAVGPARLILFVWVGGMALIALALALT